MIREDLAIHKKSTKAYEIVFKEDGVAIDINDWTVYYTVKQNMKDSDENAKISKKITSHSDASNGTSLIELETTDTDIPTGNYYYSIDYKDDEGNTDVIVAGRLTIVAPVRNTRD